MTKKHTKTYLKLILIAETSIDLRNLKKGSVLIIQNTTVVLQCLRINKNSVQADEMSLSRQRGCHKNPEFLFTEERRKKEKPDN